MESAQRFLANFQRSSPYASTRDTHMPYSSRLSQFTPNTVASDHIPQRQSPYFAHFGPIENPLFETQTPEAEEPLDDFDRRLLQESHDHHRRPALTRASHFSKPFTPSITGNFTRVSQSDFHHDSMPPRTSSSPDAPVTSPTVSALENRHRNRATIRSPNTNTLSTLDADAAEDPIVGPKVPPAVTKSFGNRPAQSKPPLKTQPIVQGIQLVPATALPDQLRSMFKFEIFNAVQSKCFPSAFQSDDNLVVSAPTGSGKTVIMELAICRLVTESKGQDFKVVYQAPTRSLCAERCSDWQRKFNVLNLECAELTGDTDYTHLRNVQKASIIVTTPEKWDSVTRKWKDHAKLMQLVRLFLVDEVHILKDARGATLEAVVSRMKSVVSNIRFVALSATVPNSEDIAVWLGKNSTTQHLPARREVFGEIFRPVQLQKHVYGFEARSNDFAFESMLTQQIPEVVANHGRGKPVMVFCSTRKASVTTAKVLAEVWLESHPMQRPWKGPERQLHLMNAELKATAMAGVAFHHGGLSVDDRRIVEQAFLTGQINIICSTSTLAVGVNLPCYLVILKGTCAWTDSGMKEYADLEVMQMLGRAGRPQFETSACAVILCRKEKVPRYEKMVSGEELLESCLHQNLIEHLNAEIVLGTVSDVASAKQWLASTFLYVRMKKSPTHYQLEEGIQESTDDESVEELCKKDIDLLLGAGIVEERHKLVSTMFGEAMARYYVTFETMKSFIGLPPNAKMSEILSLVAQAREFREVRMMAGEKSFYKEINKAPEIKFPIKVDIALPAHKISLLMQAEMGSVSLPDGENHKKHHQQYRIDRSTVFAHANRLIRCVIDCQIQLKDAISARHALELGRSFAAHVWDNTASQLRQVEGLGEVAVRKLAAASINSIDVLLNTEPSRIELVLGKNPPFGHQVLKKLESFPNLRVSVKETGREIRNGKGATVKIIADIGFLNETVPQSFNKKPFSVCFLAEDSHGSLVDFLRISPKKLARGEQINLTVQLNKPTSRINCYVMCDDIAGTSKYAELKLADIPASIYPSPPAKDDSLDLGAKRDGAVKADPSFDEFDDGGIDDQELLAAVPDGSAIEVIEDIDTIFETEHKKNKASQHEIDVDGDIQTYHEPTQLPNGRWTCQHDCNGRDKQCKHKCCKEGVAKPKRKPKAEVKIKEPEKGQKKLTTMASMQPKVKHGQESKVEPKDRLEARVSTDSITKTKNNNSRKRNQSFDGTEHARSRSCSSVSLTKQKSHPSEPATKRSKQSNVSTTDFWGEEPDIDFDSDAELDRLVGDGKKASPDQPAGDLTPVQNEDLPLFDEDDFFDFSWVEEGTLDDQPAATAPSGPAQNNIGGAEASLAEVDLITPDEDGSHLLASDTDLGGFEPPVKHVAMSDVLKKGRNPVDYQSSSTAKNSDCLRDGMGYDGDFSGTPGNLVSDLVDQQQQSDDPFHVPEDFDSDTETPAELSVETPGNTALKAMPDRDTAAITDIYANETKEEQEKRLYEEDQKKKWEGLDQWLYDEFHDFVELV